MKHIITPDGRTGGSLDGARCGRQTTDDAGEVTPSGRGGRGQRERERDRETERRTDGRTDGGDKERRAHGEKRRGERGRRVFVLFCFVLGEDESCVVVVVVVCVCVRAARA